MRIWKLVFKLAIAFIALYYVLSLLGCINNPKKKAEQLAQCYAHYHGYYGRVEVEYFDTEDWRDCYRPGLYGLGPGPGGKCLSLGMARPMKYRDDGRATFMLYEPWVEGKCEAGMCGSPLDMESLNVIVAHEVCHVSGIWDEYEAVECEHRSVEEAGCFQKEKDE